MASGMKADDEEVLRTHEYFGQSPYGPIYRGEVGGGPVNVFALESLLNDFSVTPLSVEGRRFSEHLSELFSSRNDQSADTNLLISPIGIQWPDDGKEEDVPAIVTEAFQAGERFYGSSDACRLGKSGSILNQANGIHPPCHAVGSSPAEENWCEPLDVCDLVDIACDLSSAVSSLHRRCQVHGNICPALVAIRKENRHAKARLCNCYVAESAYATLLSSGTSRPGALVRVVSPPERWNCPSRPLSASEDVYAFGVTMLELTLGQRLTDVTDDLKKLSAQHPFHKLIADCTGSQPQLRPKMSSVAKRCESLRLHNSYISTWSPRVDEYVRKLEDDNQALESQVDSYQAQLKRCNGLLEGLVLEETELQQRVLTLQEEFCHVSEEHQKVLSLMEDWKTQREATPATNGNGSNTTNNGGSRSSHRSSSSLVNGHGSPDLVLSKGGSHECAAYSANGKTTSPQGASPELTETVGDVIEPPALSGVSRDGMALPEINGEPQERMPASSQLDGNTKYNSFKRKKRSSTVESASSPSRGSPRQKLSALLTEDEPAPAANGILSTESEAVSAGNSEMPVLKKISPEVRTESPLTRRIPKKLSDSAFENGTSGDITPTTGSSSMSSYSSVSLPPSVSAETSAETEVFTPATSVSGDMVSDFRQPSSVGAAPAGAKPSPADATKHSRSDGIRRRSSGSSPLLSESPTANKPQGDTSKTAGSPRTSDLRRSQSQRSVTPQKNSEQLPRRTRQRSASPVNTKRSPTLRDKQPPAGCVQRMAELFRGRAHSGSDGSHGLSPPSQKDDFDGMRRRSMSFTHLAKKHLEPDQAEVVLQPQHKRAGRAKSMIPIVPSAALIAATAADLAAFDAGRNAKKRMTSVSERVGAAREQGIADDTWWMIKK